MKIAVVVPPVWWAPRRSVPGDGRSRRVRDGTQRREGGLIESWGATAVGPTWPTTSAWVAMFEGCDVVVNAAGRVPAATARCAGPRGAHTTGCGPRGPLGRGRGPRRARASRRAGERVAGVRRPCRRVDRRAEPPRHQRRHRADLRGRVSRAGLPDSTCGRAWFLRFGRIFATTRPRGSCSAEPGAAARSASARPRAGCTPSTPTTSAPRWWPPSTPPAGSTTSAPSRCAGSTCCAAFSRRRRA